VALPGEVVALARLAWLMMAARSSAPISLFWLFADNQGK
jgi:hypothetical protein